MVGRWQSCGRALTAWMAIWAVGCGGTGNTGVQGQDASKDVLRGDQESVTVDSSPSDAARDATSDSVASDAVTTACAASAEAYCSIYLSCETFAFESYFGNLATCEQRLEQFCPDQFSAPGTAASPSDVEACVRATSDQTCGQFLTNVLPPACLGPTGRVA
jgi:hypothetical protein